MCVRLLCCLREEGEKLNVWVAWMNLENLYGSHEQLVKVFESALQQNEPLEVFLRLVAIYEQSNKMEVRKGKCRGREDYRKIKIIMIILR
jgi:rRNA biogenesis protein RRP5